MYEFIDVDECQTDNGGCNQTCTNNHGSYECSCDIGYTIANITDCQGKHLANLLSCIEIITCDIATDVDECQTNNGGCDQTCINTDSSFECSCGEGFMLAANNLDCEGRIH